MQPARATTLPPANTNPEIRGVPSAHRQPACSCLQDWAKEQVQDKPLYILPHCCTPSLTRAATTTIYKVQYVAWSLRSAAMPAWATWPAVDASDATTI